MAAKEAKEAAEIAAHQASIDKGASSLAEATGGSVVQSEEDDII